jgi:glutamate synthase domain-containing protein 2
MSTFWAAILAWAVIMLLIAALLLLLRKPIISFFFNTFTKVLMTDTYAENLAEMFTVVSKFTPQLLLECELRATTGKSLERPFGTALHFSKWEYLFFNPVYLSRLPLADGLNAGTDVVIGPKARRPLTLQMPIMIGGMAYGNALSAAVKVALAKAASAVGISANTGHGPFLKEEREAADKLVLQYSKGQWAHDEEIIMQADMIEIVFGRGSIGGATVPISPKAVEDDPRFAELIGYQPGENAKIPRSFPNIKDPGDLKKLVNRLRSITGGVPIGAKIGATHYLEQEMDIFIEAGVDVIAVCGAEGGTHASAASLLDSFGLPTMPALIRAAHYFESKKLRGKVSLLIGGGLVEPGQFLKALALGADAVFIGTAALVGLVHTQSEKILPWEPPTVLVYNVGHSSDKFDIEAGAKSLANFLRSCNSEMQEFAAAMGRSHINQINKTDLCSIHPQLAKIAGVDLAWQP